MELQTTTITIMRGTTVSKFGDRTDVGTPLHTGVPAALTETSKQVFDRATARPQTIRTTMCVVPDWTDVTLADTIRDERTGNYYMIESLQVQPTLGPPPDKILVLRSRSGVTPASDRPATRTG
jgi:hypothetical protein